MPVPLLRFALLITLLTLLPLPVFGAAQIYYNGTGSGTTVTTLGTLGAAGNGLLQTGSTGTGSFLTSGGALGSGDGFLSLSSSSNNGARVSVPAASLANFNHTSWPIGGWFQRTSTSNNTDVVFHLGTGDTLGAENEL
jgi:TM2 domain-containing membrane protein YozV